MKKAVKLACKLEQRGVTSECLDNFVHQVATYFARELRDDGLKAQVKFLLEQGYTEEEILEEAIFELDLDNENKDLGL